jgi:hypothetical protein
LKPYEAGWDGDPAAYSGQNRAFIAGIVESPLTSDYAVVGIQPDGRLGTLSPDEFQGPPGPQGPAGPGLVRGSLLFLRTSVAPPEGYVFLGTTPLVLRLPNGRSTTLPIAVYQKQ